MTSLCASYDGNRVLQPLGAVSLPTAYAWLVQLVPADATWFVEVDE